jgi:hypothetical protein
MRLPLPAPIAFLLAITLFACSSDPGPTDSVSARNPVPAASPDDPFLDTLQSRTFDWFWETTNAANGLVPDRAPDPPFSSIAAVGFGLTAYGVGVERGYVSRPEAVERTLTTLRFFWEAPMGPDASGMSGHRGFYYHFLDMDTGHRYQTNELSTIDTALLMMGVLFSRQYYDRDDPEEAEIRALADSLYQRVEWDWAQFDRGIVSMGWKPEEGLFDYGYQGYNEAMFLYILGLGSPTHPIRTDAWDAYTSTYEWADFYSYEHVNFSPLFGHQYSHVWIDFREIQDAAMRERGIDYFENSRRATQAQRAYAIDNPDGWRGYGPNIWGLTACDGPANVTRTVDGEERRFHTYWARGASEGDIRDDGTIAPTAAGGSIPFAPGITIAALKAIRKLDGGRVFNQYGFLDAFNPTFTFTDAEVERGTVDPTRGWVDDQQLGIDQGPILLMAENYRTGFVWEVMKQSPYIVRGLERAGFQGGWLDAAGESSQ